MGIWKPSFPRSIIKVTDYRYGLPLRHIVSHLMNRIHIQKVSLSLIRGLDYTERKRSDENINDLGIIYTTGVSVADTHTHTHTHTSPHPSLLLTKWHEKTKQTMRNSHSLSLRNSSLWRMTLTDRCWKTDFLLYPTDICLSPPVCSCMDQIVEDVSQMLDCLLTRLAVTQHRNWFTDFFWQRIHILKINPTHLASEYLSTGL